MSKSEKLLTKFGQSQKTFAWAELVSLLDQLGYSKEEKEGSRVRFYHPDTKHMIRMHRPHPDKNIKGGALKDLKQQLKQEGYL